MFVKLTTYDCEYGDATLFDEYVFCVDTFENLKNEILNRFQSLLKSRTLLIDRENGYPNIVETRSGKTAESYLTAYQSVQNAEDDVDGLPLWNGIFFDPDMNDISCGSDTYTIWERLSEEVEVLSSWQLDWIIDNQPWELNGDKGLADLQLIEFLFDLYSGHLKT